MSVTSTPGKHRYGHNRPKSNWDWGFQIAYGIFVVAMLVIAASGGYVALVFAFTGTLAIIWTEWAARCEDRSKVLKASAVLLAIFALLEARSRQQNAQVAQRRQTHPGSPSGPGADGKWSALDYGDR